MSTMTETTSPRIYVASLSDYNAGRLHGEWIDAAQDADDIAEAVQAMLAESPEAKLTGQPAEEWAIHDYEGFEGFRLSEWESFEKVAAIANGLEEHGAPFAVWVNDLDGDPTDEDAFAEAYVGTYDSAEGYAAELVEEGMFGEVPDELRYYIDNAAIARDLRLGGDNYFADAGAEGVYVFRCF